MKRILIVDGDMAVRAQIGRYARLEGYDVAEASDGYTAVALFRQSTFDFVILAVMLPELDGFSVCQTIRSFSQVPILILSERGDEADRIRGLELGADDCSQTLLPQGTNAAHLRHHEARPPSGLHAPAEHRAGRHLYRPDRPPGHGGWKPGQPDTEGI